MIRGAWAGLAAAAGLALAGAALAQGAAPGHGYVGSERCSSCHSAEYEAWRRSDHHLAMQVADTGTVLGDFSDARFTKGREVSSFSTREGRPFVHTVGPGGADGDFPVAYSFGLHPLQQYLLPLGGGRLQAFGVAWDSRAKEQGGGRWFDLNPERALAPGDPLHWTGIDQNWNYQCADCHATNLRKGYDEAAAAFRTTWSEIGVGCEACHGPGSEHLVWAETAEGERRSGPGSGFAVAFDERKGAGWTIDPATGNAVRARRRETSREIESCARCHARRGQFSDAWQPGRPLGDAFRVSLLEPGLYHADGQQREEVYTHGSFLQSRMFAAGVTCSDCHDPHSERTRASGNALCAQCHAPAKYDGPAHTHHAAGSAGAECTACHMPATTYMVVDPRRDHGFRIPRPDRSAKLGVPNPCNGCHPRQSAEWASLAVANWFPERKPGFQDFAEGFHAGDLGAPGAQRALVRIAEGADQPALVRASALARLGRFPSPSTLLAVRGALADSDPLVRAAAASALAAANAATRAQLLPHLLDDPVRQVRMDAARGLAGDAEPLLPAPSRAAFERALDEWSAAQHFAADRPEAQAALASLAAQRGRFEEAAAAYRTALALDPSFLQAGINLADLERARGREDEAERTLREMERHAPESGAVHHALGLGLVRRGQLSEALAELSRAAELAPEEPRFAYVRAVALHDTGRPAEALAALREARKRHPFDRQILFALAGYEREAGNLEGARECARLLVELEPESPELAQLARELEPAGR